MMQQRYLSHVTRLPASRVPTEAAAEVQFSRGARYLGPLSGGRCRGQGDMELGEGGRLRGRFEDAGVFTGEYRYGNGDVFTGSCVSTDELLEHGLGEYHRQGRGEMVFAAGSFTRYTGLFDKDVMNDEQAVLFLVDEAGIFTGRVEGGRPVTGLVVFGSSGDEYCGPVDDQARPQGHGRVTAATTGVQLVGTFSGGLLQGPGQLLFANGDQYMGGCGVCHARQGRVDAGGQESGGGPVDRRAVFRAGDGRHRDHSDQYGGHRGAVIFAAL